MGFSTKAGLSLLTISKLDDPFLDLKEKKHTTVGGSTLHGFYLVTPFKISLFCVGKSKKILSKDRSSNCIFFSVL